MHPTTDRSRILASVMTLAVAFAAMRAMGTLGPATWRWLLPAGFVLMALTPPQRRDPAGPRGGGHTPAPHRGWDGPARGRGALAALLCFATGAAVFGTGSGNWYVSIAGSYARMMDTSAFPPMMLHLVFTTPALLFSPIGEEIFFRGVLQGALEREMSARMATTLECGLFAVVHLCHHGVVRTADGLDWMPLSAVLWMVLMFGTAWLFATLRRRSGSLYPAIVAHMAFNGAMNGVIFGYLWPVPA
jgi:membrane protease YdiL (CAAX protease family)